MIDILPDDEIAQLIAEAKTLPRNYRDKLAPIEVGGHRRGQVEVLGVSGRVYLVYVRQLVIDPDNFSVGLIWKMPGRDFRLRRYNGPWQPHSNKIERERFTAPHIHTATYRYQRLGLDEDQHAEATDRFSSPSEAFQCLLEDCKIEDPLAQREMFSWRLPW